MATFNSKFVRKEILSNKNTISECVRYMLICLCNEDYDLLEKDFYNCGGFESNDWDLFVFNRVQVTYDRFK